MRRVAPSTRRLPPLGWQGEALLTEIARLAAEGQPMPGSRHFAPLVGLEGKSAAHFKALLDKLVRHGLITIERLPETSRTSMIVTVVATGARTGTADDELTDRQVRMGLPPTEMGRRAALLLDRIKSLAEAGEPMPPLKDLMPEIGLDPAQITAGNMSAYLRMLEKAGLVSVEKYLPWMRPCIAVTVLENGARTAAAAKPVVFGRRKRSTPEERAAEAEGRRLLREAEKRAREQARERAREEKAAQERARREADRQARKTEKQRLKQAEQRMASARRRLKLVAEATEAPPKPTKFVGTDAQALIEAAVKAGRVTRIENPAPSADKTAPRTVALKPGQRRCLRCSRPFTPAYRGNFICSAHERDGAAF